MEGELVTEGLLEEGQMYDQLKVIISLPSLQERGDHKRLEERKSSPLLRSLDRISSSVRTAALILSKFVRGFKGRREKLTGAGQGVHFVRP